MEREARSAARPVKPEELRMSLESLGNGETQKAPGALE
jgi:hypothetical protein